jgi:hypothetical protein
VSSVSPSHAVTLLSAEAVLRGAKTCADLKTDAIQSCVGCAPGPEPAPFVDVGLPSFAVDDGDEFPPGDDDEPFPDSWPVISACDARFDTGPVDFLISGGPGRKPLPT